MHTPRWLHALKVCTHSSSVTALPLIMKVRLLQLPLHQSCFWGMHPSISTTSGHPSYLFVSLLFLMCCWNTTVGYRVKDRHEPLLYRHILQCTHFSNTHVSDACTPITVPDSRWATLGPSRPSNSQKNKTSHKFSKGSSVSQKVKFTFF